jgi:hypothetical protein
MARRRKRKRARINWLMIVAIALLIAGFLARRLMMPSAARFLAQHTQEYPAPAPRSGDSNHDNGQAAHSADNGSGEHLSDSDRRALDEVIRRKTGGH